MLSLRVLVVFAALLVSFQLAESHSSSHYYGRYGPYGPYARHGQYAVCEEYKLPLHASWIVTEDCDELNRAYKCDDGYHLEVMTVCDMSHGKWGLSYTCSNSNHTAWARWQGAEGAIFSPEIKCTFNWYTLLYMLKTGWYMPKSMYLNVPIKFSSPLDPSEPQQ